MSKTITEAVRAAGAEAKAVGCWVVKGRKDFCLVGGVIVDALNIRGKLTDEHCGTISKIIEELPHPVREVGTKFDWKIQGYAEKCGFSSEDYDVSKKPVPKQMRKPVEDDLIRNLKRSYKNWAGFVSFCKRF